MGPARGSVADGWLIHIKKENAMDKKELKKYLAGLSIAGLLAGASIAGIGCATA